MYPLNMTNPDVCGFAVANDADEHRELLLRGYGPGFQDAPAADAPPADAADDVEALRAALDAAGKSYDKRWGVAKLRAALDA